MMNIDKLVETLLAHYWDEILPIDPIKIANALNVPVFERDNKMNDSFNLNGLYATYERQNSISYHVKDSLIFKRFIIAHMLGHYCLNHSTPKIEHLDIIYSKDQEEMQANQFAKLLLMPEYLVRYYYSNKNIASVEHLASIFGVSKDAMGYRLLEIQQPY